MKSSIGPQLSRLDAPQGSIEARSELYIEVLRMSTADTDAAERQERWQSVVLCATAGQRGGRLWV